MSDKQPEKSKAEVHVKRECALQKHKTDFISSNPGCAVFHLNYW